MVDSPDQTGQGQPARESPPEPGRSEGGQAPARESGGPKGLEPTRYGDWERKGRCIDF